MMCCEMLQAPQTSHCVFVAAHRSTYMIVPCRTKPPPCCPLRGLCTPAHGPITPACAFVRLQELLRLMPPLLLRALFDDLRPDSSAMQYDAMAGGGPGTSAARLTQAADEALGVKATVQVRRKEMKAQPASVSGCQSLSERQSCFLLRFNSCRAAAVPVPPHQIILCDARLPSFQSTKALCSPLTSFNSLLCVTTPPPPHPLCPQTG